MIAPKTLRKAINLRDPHQNPPRTTRQISATRQSSATRTPILRDHAAPPRALRNLSAQHAAILPGPRPPKTPVSGSPNPTRISVRPFPVLRSPHDTLRRWFPGNGCSSWPPAAYPRQGSLASPRTMDRMADLEGFLRSRRAEIQLEDVWLARYSEPSCVVGLRREGVT